MSHRFLGSSSLAATNSLNRCIGRTTGSSLSCFSFSTTTGSSPSPSISRKRERQREREERYQNKYNVLRREANRPNLQSLLRALYRRAHPDIIRSSAPELAEVNNASLQLLNGVLSTLKVPNQYPERLNQSIPFHVKEGETITRFELKLVTAGGDSKRQLTATFSAFFRDIGELSTQDFSWDKEYFPMETAAETTLDK